MPPQTRTTSFPQSKIIIDRDSDTENSSSDDDDDDIDNSQPPPPQEEDKSSTSKKITISLKKLCKVCKKPGHEAGFKGATYIDCPMKPCFLCKLPGHTTLNCPHRVATEFGVVPAPCNTKNSLLEYVFQRQLIPRIKSIKPAFVIPKYLSCGVVRYHSRRITCLEFHPTLNNIIISGDKKGQFGVWDFGKVHEKIVYGNIHTCILNNVKFKPTNDGTIYGASSDGTVSCIDLETGISTTVTNLNPDGWQVMGGEAANLHRKGVNVKYNADLNLPSGWDFKGPSRWKMLYGLDTNPDRGVLLAADNFGFLHMVDMRTNSVIGEPVLLHKKGSKVTGLHCHPLQPDLMLSCGNDHFARIWDMRLIESGSSLHNLSHKRVVNSAYFSPQSGSKILTTSQDNRIRVWDSIFGDLDSPSREIVHSHDFNRHLTPFRAEWDPKDVSESLVVVGRYISENFNGTALHPIDFIDISTGQLVAEVMDPNITTISPVNKLHPRDDILASGSSRSIFIWRPMENIDVKEEQESRRIVVCGKGKKKFDDGSDDEFNDATKGSKKSKNKKPSLEMKSKVHVSKSKR